MEREPMSGRDNAIIGGQYGGDGSANTRAEEARQRAVLAGEQAQLHPDPSSSGTSMRGDGGTGTGQHSSMYERTEQGKEKAANKIEHASDQIRSQAQGGPAAPVGEKLAGTLDKTADYLHEHETTEIIDDVRAFIRRNPLAGRRRRRVRRVLARTVPAVVRSVR